MKVMVALDESDESFYALQWAVDNLFNYDGLITTPASAAAAAAAIASGEANLLTLIHVHPSSKQYVVAPSAFPAGPGVAAYPSTAVVDALRKSHEQVSANILSRALEICQDKVKAETLIVEGDPKEKICEMSEQMSIDLLIVGSRGLGRIQRAFLGSVSDYCAHYAKCPTLIVKPPKDYSTKAKAKD